MKDVVNETVALGGLVEEHVLHLGRELPHPGLISSILFNMNSFSPISVHIFMQVLCTS